MYIASVFSMTFKICTCTVFLGFISVFASIMTYIYIRHYRNKDRNNPPKTIQVQIQNVTLNTEAMYMYTYTLQWIPLEKWCSIALYICVYI